MYGGYENRFAPLGETSERQMNKRKKRASSDTSAPRSPHPHLSNENAEPDISPMSSAEFEKLDLNGKMNCLFELISRSAPMISKLDSINETLYQNKAIFDVTEARLRLLEYKSLDMETRMLRTNLVISGIAESTGSDEEALSEFKQFLSNHMSIDPNTSGVVSAFRIGRRQVIRGRSSPRAIIATFSNARYVDNIMSNVRILRNKPYGVSRDYPREIREARKELWPSFKEARGKYGRTKVKLVFPAALVIHGETVKNLFPGWHEILRESRNSDVRARTTLRLQTIVDTTLRAQGQFQATEAQTPPEADSNDHPGLESHSDPEESDIVSPSRGAQQKSADLPITKPGYLLDKHPIMTNSGNPQPTPTPSANVNPSVDQDQQSQRVENPPDPPSANGDVPASST